MGKRWNYNTRVTHAIWYPKYKGTIFINHNLLIKETVCTHCSQIQHEQSSRNIMWCLFNPLQDIPLGICISYFQEGRLEGQLVIVYHYACYTVKIYAAEEKCLCCLVDTHKLHLSNEHIKWYFVRLNVWHRRSHLHDIGYSRLDTSFYVDLESTFQKTSDKLVDNAIIWTLTSYWAWTAKQDAFPHIPFGSFEFYAM